jgi:hypothetical protein
MTRKVSSARHFAGHPGDKVPVFLWARDRMLGAVGACPPALSRLCGALAGQRNHGRHRWRSEVLVETPDF